MIELRPRKKSDQKQIKKAYDLIHKLMEEHPEIEPTLWAGACWSTLVNGYLKSDIPYKEFCEGVDSVKKHYESWWEDRTS